MPDRPVPLRNRFADDLAVIADRDGAADGRHDRLRRVHPEQRGDRCEKVGDRDGPLHHLRSLRVRLAYGDATAHAEMLVLRDAARILGAARLVGCTIYVTLEPCAMCAGALVLARVDRVVFGAWDDKAGMAGSVGDLLRHPRLNHRPEVQGGVRVEECASLLRDFFASRRGRIGERPAEH